MKKTIHDLAILGGAQAFSEKLHVGSPNIGDRGRLLERINDLLNRRWLTNNGPFVQELERRIAEMHGVKHCIVVCNATVGLEIAIKALGMSGEVIIPSMTFVATAHALQWQEIRPVFAISTRRPIILILIWLRNLSPRAQQALSACIFLAALAM